MIMALSEGDHTATDCDKTQVVEQDKRTTTTTTTTTKKKRQESPLLIDSLSNGQLKKNSPVLELNGRPLFENE